MELGASGEPDRIGPYRVLRRIGRGGMGVVYEVEREASSDPMALKTIETRFVVDDDIHARRRFEHEIRVLNRLTHPNVVQIHDAGLASHPQGYEILFMVTERLFGHALEEQLKNARTLSTEDALRVTRDLARALTYLAEQGVEHRDVKPSNIFITEDGRTVLIDFGLATRGDLTRLTQAGQVIGSQSYMSPERLSGRETGTTSDVFALGVVLYRMITGHLPFVARTLTDLAVKMIQGLEPDKQTALTPAELRDLVVSMLHAEPSDRPAPTDVVARIERLLEGLSTTQAHDMEARRLNSGTGEPGRPLPSHLLTEGTEEQPEPGALSLIHQRTLLLVALGAFAGGIIMGFGGARALGPSGAEMASGLETPTGGSRIIDSPPAEDTEMASGLETPTGGSRIIDPPPAETEDEKPENARSEASAPAPRSPLERRLPTFTSAEAAYNYGRFAFLEGHFDRAVPALQRAIELNPVMAPAHRTLGDVHRALGHHRQAEKAYRTFLVLRPNSDANEVERWLSDLPKTGKTTP